ncbi:MAG: hypothetical protein RL701_7337 [Pseudomonadota bacterium]|jgi:threonyl-tRNA synthetase
MNAQLAETVIEPEPELRPLRRWLADVLVQALIAYVPGSQLGAVEASEHGFHADFALPRPLHPEDLPEIQQRMRECIASGTVAPVQPVAFELRSIGGAYLQGDADQAMLTRLSVWAYPAQAQLIAAREQYERAALRDHKKLGRELELFTFDDDIGAGLPLWLPNGTAIRDELEGLMRGLEFAAGFERVATPHLAQKRLYERTGHLPYFADGMFPLMQRAGAGENSPIFALRPMNCPHHHAIFAARKRSYRELPFRISEYGHVYRYEDSGAVSGLLRTRCMCMNDGHIYCAREQVRAELHAVLDMHARVYEILGLSDYRIRLSTHGASLANDKFVDDPQGWAESEAILRSVLEERKLAFFEGPGEAAFYGPKIDFQFRMVTGREETASTLQLDFAIAKRLDLSYVGPNGEAERPFILHRAPLGTHERFVALLIERFAGAFPTWLAPVQARVLPVSDQFEPYAREVQASLRAQRVRAQLDPADDSLGKRVRRAAVEKVPNVIVVGERERADRSVALRRYGVAGQTTLPLSAACERIVQAIAARTLDVVVI